MLCCVFSLKHCKTFWHRSFIFSLIVSLGLVHQGTILLLALSRRVFLWFLHILFVPLYAATRWGLSKETCARAKSVKEFHKGSDFKRILWEFGQLGYSCTWQLRTAGDGFPKTDPESSLLVITANVQCRRIEPADFAVMPGYWRKNSRPKAWRRSAEGRYLCDARSPESRRNFSSDDSMWSSSVRCCW